MADITISEDDTLEIDAIIEESGRVDNVISIPDRSDYNIAGIQTHTGVFDPQGTGEYSITVNGQELTVQVNKLNTIPESGLVHKFLFNEGSGTSFSDTVGNANGSLNGATWKSGVGSGNYYIDTDGSDDKLRTDSNISISGTEDRTIVAWINYHDEGRFFWEYGNNDSNGGRMAIKMRNGNEVYHSMHFESASITGIDYSPILDGWGFIAHRTQNGDKLKIDIESGTANESSGSVSSDVWDTNIDNFKLGWNTVGGNAYTDVDFGEIYIYDRYLSDSELSDIRAATADNYPV